MCEYIVTRAASNERKDSDEPIMTDRALARRVLTTYRMSAINASKCRTRSRMRAQRRNEHRGETKALGKSHAKGRLREVRLKRTGEETKTGPIDDETERLMQVIVTVQNRVETNKVLRRNRVPRSGREGEKLVLHMIVHSSL